eukprot:8265594-Pyramimonas_sp.AAC.1
MSECSGGAGWQGGIRTALRAASAQEDEEEGRRSRVPHNLVNRKGRRERQHQCQCCVVRVASVIPPPLPAEGLQ